MSYIDIVSLIELHLQSSHFVRLNFPTNIEINRIRFHIPRICGRIVVGAAFYTLYSLYTGYLDIDTDTHARSKFIFPGLMHVILHKAYDFKLEISTNC